MSGGFSARGVEDKTWECHAARKMFAKKPGGRDVGTETEHTSPDTEELALLRESKSVHLPRHCNGMKSDQGGKSGRRDGPVEERRAQSLG